MMGLGTAALLLAFGTWAAVRAAYTYDDSNLEILVYAQGSSDLRETYRRLDQEVLQSPEQDGAVQVDYDLWYPFQWYVRHDTQAGTLQFACFKDASEDGWNSGCGPVPEDPEARALLLTAQHSNHQAENLTQYQRGGPYRNLLWFPETYRRPGEDRQAEPPLEELARDIQFFQEVATSRAAWHSALDYLIYRDLQSDWFTSEYYSYLQEE